MEAKKTTKKDEILNSHHSRLRSQWQVLNFKQGLITIKHGFYENVVQR